ncbi:hypothetical protein [Pseudophaeobacter sp.]|uniref:hypothetical protein n=1 Tax=Pseudophaeobacter sp. TaxID=1971739 RepID=UPI0032980A42
MQEEWLSRLEELITRDGRSNNELSLAAGYEPSYVSLLVQRQIPAKLSTLSQLLKVLGPDAPSYVITGHAFTAADAQFLEAIQSLDQEGKQAALCVLQRWQDEEPQ